MGFEDFYRMSDKGESREGGKDLVDACHPAAFSSGDDNQAYPLIPLSFVCLWHLPRFGLGEYYPARCRLEDSGYVNILKAVKKTAASLDHDHGPVIQECNSLTYLFSFLDDVYCQFFAGQHHGFERVGELVYVQHLDPLDLSDSVQIEICS